MRRSADASLAGAEVRGFFFTTGSGHRVDGVDATSNPLVRRGSATHTAITLHDSSSCSVKT